MKNQNGNPILCSCYSVDTVIETMDITRDTQRDLLACAPNAYQTEVLLDEVWAQLTETSRQDIIAADNNA